MHHGTDKPPETAWPNPHHLMLFTRYPVPGQTKTRLIPHLGPARAAALQRQMTEYILNQITEAARHLPLAAEVHFSGGSLAQMQDWLGDRPTVTYHSQAEGTLGDRLIAAFEQSFEADCFEAGRLGAIAIGSDCPALGVEHLSAAVEALQQVDVAIGPATDGGYYLIGLAQPQPALFQTIDWGTERVLAQTLAAAADQGLSIELLAPLTDIDLPEDLPEWEKICSPARPPW
jgi:rSAM/selenodomain-associated transferase 1